MLALREQRALGGTATRRASSQLATLGKLKAERKIRATVPDAYLGIMPEGHAFTCVSVFESILRGDFEPLYTCEGKSILRERAEAALQGGASGSG